YALAVQSHDEVGYLTARFLDMRQHQRTYVRSLEDVARAKSEFINLASHELRTPISIIRCYHELMADGQLGPTTPPQEQALQAIGESVATLTQIAENATTMAQIDSARLVLHREEHDAGDLIEQAVAVARAAATDRDVQVECEIDEALGPVDADGPQLTHAIAQLVSNGIRFTPDGGSVHVRAARVDDGWDIEVTDTGVSIPEERRVNIFDRAVTLG